jgi:hypothetical protein
MPSHEKRRSFLSETQVVSELDSLEDLLPAVRPAAFDVLPHAERSWRFRVFLATWAIGAPLDLSWAMALNDSAEHVLGSQVTLSEISDDALRAAVTARADALDAGGADQGAFDVVVTQPAAGLNQQPVLIGRMLTPPTITRGNPASPGRLLWDELLADSRARSAQPSRVTILLRPKRPPTSD